MASSGGSRSFCSRADSDLGTEVCLICLGCHSDSHRYLLSKFYVCAQGKSCRVLKVGSIFHDRLASLPCKGSKLIRAWGSVQKACRKLSSLERDECAISSTSLEGGACVLSSKKRGACALERALDSREHEALYKSLVKSVPLYSLYSKIDELCPAAIISTIVVPSLVITRGM